MYMVLNSLNVSSNGIEFSEICKFPKNIVLVEKCTLPGFEGHVLKPISENDYVKIKYSNNMFWDFISLNPESDKDILDYCNRYTIPGVGYMKSLSSEEPFPKVFIDDISEISHEIKKIKMILNINELLNSENTEKLYNESKKLYEHCGSGLNFEGYYENLIKFSPAIDPETNKKYDNFYELAYLAAGLIKVELFQNLKEVHPVLHPEITTDNINVVKPKIQLKGFWNVTCLIQGIYLELFLLLTQGKIIRKCKNRTCPDYFEVVGSYTKKIYCNSDCAKLEAKRNERDRKKNK